MTQEYTEEKAEQIEALFNAKIEANYAQLYQNWRSAKPEMILQNAELIAAAKEMFTNAEYSFEPAEKAYLLKFENPLEILGDALENYVANLNGDEFNQIVKNFVDGQELEHNYDLADATAEQQEFMELKWN